jgi:tRNA(Ile)-lysidine synthase
VSGEFLVGCLDDCVPVAPRGLRFAIAVSGGRDSLCLLLVAKKWAEERGAGLVALTVDHRLREESAGEALYVQRLCEIYGIEHRTLVWTDGKLGSNLESRAREARYGLISSFCRENSIEYLFVAHHREDQAETFFLRLFRGSGVDGLSSMRKVTNIFGLNILRPFLDVHRSQLERYLLDRGVEWIEDPSNSDLRFLRNRIRHFLNGFENRDEITNRISFALEEIDRLRNRVAGQIRDAQRRYLDFNDFGTCLMDREILLAEDRDIVLGVLANTLMRLGGRIYRPRRIKLERLFDHLTARAASDPILPYTICGCVLESYGTRSIIVYREYNSLAGASDLTVAREIVWDGRFTVLLEEEREGIAVTHLREGEFNTLLRRAREENSPLSKDLESLRGVEKRILYTLPIVTQGASYLLHCKSVRIAAVHPQTVPADS